VGCGRVWEAIRLRGRPKTSFSERILKQLDKNMPAITGAEPALQENVKRVVSLLLDWE
jgi:hypothetical protein